MTCTLLKSFAHCVYSYCCKSISRCFLKHHCLTMKRASSRPQQLKEQLLQAIDAQNNVSKYVGYASLVVTVTSFNYLQMAFSTHSFIQWLISFMLKILQEDNSKCIQKRSRTHIIVFMRERERMPVFIHLIIKTFFIP